MDTPFKKRHRVPASCSVCRKRKSKCDRVRPVCGSCKKKSIAHLCFYGKEKGDEDPGNERQGLDYLGTTDIPCDPQSQFQHHNHLNQPSATPQMVYGSIHSHTPHYPYPSTGQPPVYSYMQPNKASQPPIGIPHGSLPTHQMQPQIVQRQGVPVGQLPQHQTPNSSNHSMQGHSMQANLPQLQPTPSPQSQELNLGSNQMLRHQSMKMTNHQASNAQLGSQSTPQQSNPNQRHSPIHQNGSIDGSTTKVPYLPQTPATLQTTGPLSASSGASNSSGTPASTPGSVISRQATSLRTTFPLPYQRPRFSSSIQTPSTNVWTPNIKLAPIQGVLKSKTDNSEFIYVDFGLSTSLKINVNDTMDIFTNCSYSLVIEGPYWMQHGCLSYTALTKGDPFIKFFRSYAVSLFKTGELSKFLLTEYSKKRKSKKINSSRNRKHLKSNPANELDSTLTSSSESIKKEDTNTEDDDEDENELDEMLAVEDSIIVSKVKLSNDSQSSDNGQEKSCIDIPNPYNGVKSFFKAQKTQQDFYDNIAIKAALQVLPNKKSTFVLLYKYFKYVDPMVPVIEENSLLADLNKLLPESFPRFSQDKYKEVKVTHPNDMNTLSILLLITRLGYLSMIHNEETNNKYSEDEAAAVDEMKKISSEDFTKVLGLCLPDESSLKKSSIKLIQALCLSYFYTSVVPDDCHGLSSSDGQILLGSIVRHSITIGLNRDPSAFFSSSIRKKPRLISTWKKLWRWIANTDATSAMHSGSNINIRSLDIADVGPPNFDGQSDELKDLYNINDKICHIYRKIVNMISNANEYPKVMDILFEASKLEKIFVDFFGTEFFKDYILSSSEERCNRSDSLNSDSTNDKFNETNKKQNDSLEELTKKKGNITMDDSNSKQALEHEKSYTKVMKYISFIQLRTNLSCLYYMIAAHYENKYDKYKGEEMTAGIELYKIYVKSVIQMVYIMSYVLDHSVELFGKNYDYLLTPINEKCMIKTHAFVSSFFIRLLHHIKELTLKRMEDPTDESSGERLDVLENLLQTVIVDSELFVGNFRKLSSKYINSYRIYVMVYFVIKQCMANPEIFFQSSEKNSNMIEVGSNMIQFFTIQELQQLGQMCAEFRLAKDKQNKMYNMNNNSIDKKFDGQNEMEQSPSELSMYGPGAGLANFGTELPSKSDASMSSQSPNEEDPFATMTTLLFGNENPMTHNDEEFRKIFDVYNDLDQDSLGSFGF